MSQNKDSNNQAKPAGLEHIFGRIAWRHFLKAILVFAAAFIVLIVVYEQTALKRVFTDAVLETIGKVGAKWMNESYTAFYYINSPDEGRYDLVKLYTVPVGTTKNDLDTGKVKLKAVAFKLYSLCYYPVAFGLALACAMPLKLLEKIFSLG